MLQKRKMVWIGRMPVCVSMIVALFFTWEDVLGIGGEGGFTSIQKYTGFISPGVFAMFLLDMFWKRITGLAAIVGVIAGFVLSVFFSQFAPAVLGHNTWMYDSFKNDKGVYEVPFLICMVWSFALTMLIMIGISLGGSRSNPKAFELDKEMFRVKPSTLVLIIMIILTLAAIYAKFWWKVICL